MTVSIYFVDDADLLVDLDDLGADHGEVYLESEIVVEDVLAK